MCEADWMHVSLGWRTAAGSTIAIAPGSRYRILPAFLTIEVPAAIRTRSSTQQEEKGTTTTPFDMVVLNNLDRYQLAFDAIRRIPRLVDQVQKASDRYWTMMERHKLYVGEHGEDMPEVRNWRWAA